MPIDYRHTLFATGVICSCCGCDAGPSKKNENLWNGIFDVDTQSYVCTPCKPLHYKNKKEKTYSEIPVIIEQEKLKSKPKTNKYGQKKSIPIS